jgi:hypothetical protein
MKEMLVLLIFPFETDLVYRFHLFCQSRSYVLTNILRQWYPLLLIRLSY